MFKGNQRYVLYLFLFSLSIAVFSEEEPDLNNELEISVSFGDKSVPCSVLQGSKDNGCQQGRKNTFPLFLDFFLSPPSFLGGCPGGIDVGMSRRRRKARKGGERRECTSFSFSLPWAQTHMETAASSFFHPPPLHPPLPNSHSPPSSGRLEEEEEKPGEKNRRNGERGEAERHTFLRCLALTTRRKEQHGV